MFTMIPVTIRVALTLVVTLPPLNLPLLLLKLMIP